MKNKQGHHVEKGWNPEVNRRWLLRRAAMASGGVFLAKSITPSSMEAQVPTVSSSTTAQKAAPATIAKIHTAYQRIKATGNYNAISPAWGASVRDLTPVERVAAVSILEISQRNPGCRDIGGKIAAMLKATTEARADTLREIQSQVILQATGGFCGGGCSGAEGYICGGACPKIKDVMLAVDQMGAVLQRTDFANAASNYAQTAAAINGAASSYREIFG